MAGGGPRWSDRVAIGALTQTYPPALVDEVLAQTGRREQRTRLLPARMVVYYLLALALFADVAYLEVLRLLTEALRRPSRRGRGGPMRLPVKSALIQARARLGPAPLKALFDQAAVPLATPTTLGAWYRGWRLLALDGTCVDAPDTPANADAFGRPRSGRGEGVGAFPQARLVGMVECGTHAIVGAVLGPYAHSEQTLAAGLLGHLDAGVLLLADRLFAGAATWRQAQASGAALAWRVRTGRGAPRLHPERILADGSWLSRLDPEGRTGQPVVVRVLEYAIDDPGRPTATGQVYRLVTSILDPQAAPASELAVLYHQRWAVEGVLDELNTHQRGPRAVLRSKTPAMVEQEVWAHLLVHYAIRKLMHQAACDQGLDPDRLSFTGCLRIVRRRLVSHAAFSP
jgi:hypothetical protein